MAVLSVLVAVLFVPVSETHAVVAYSISGRVFNDSNADGSAYVSGADAGLSGWTVTAMYAKLFSQVGPPQVRL